MSKDEGDREQRERINKRAQKIVNKFPQIEQGVLAPMLRMEIAKAIWEERRMAMEGR